MSASKNDMETSLNNFMNIVEEAATGKDWADIANDHADKPELLDLHQKLLSENKSYKDEFNYYSQAVQSGVEASLEKELYKAKDLADQGHLTIAFSHTLFSITGHLPMLLDREFSQNKIKQVFKNNYKP